MSRERLAREREFHEGRSAERGERLTDEALRFEDGEYVDHLSPRRPHQHRILSAPGMDVDGPR